MPSQEVTQVLDAIAGGDRRAAEDLLPLVYAELRKLAKSHLAREAPGLTLQPTALVHEAYLRLVGDGSSGGGELKWDSRGHFFAAAARAMRHILVERARRVGRIKHGGDRARVEFDEHLAPSGDPEVDLVALDEAMDKLEKHNHRVCQVVMLRYFAGLSVEETARALQIGATTVKAEWSYARAWLLREVKENL